MTDIYSAQEVGIIAVQCPEHPTYHVQSESVLVEILDADGAPCRPGETGRIVVTDLMNFASPLIRYEIGDYAEVGEACPCGRGLPVLNRILGRSRNMLRLPSGDRLWPRYHVSRLTPIAPIRQVQLVQVSLQEIHVNLVVARPVTADEENALSESIGASLGHRFRLVFNYLDEIPRSPNGKFEDFRCDLDD
jgi:phenylacetate-CoA ligase